MSISLGPLNVRILLTEYVYVGRPTWTTSAKEIILTGRVVPGEEAERIGFASHVYDCEDLMAGAFEMAGQISAMNPGGVRLVLSHLDRIDDMSRDQALRWAQLSAERLDVSVTADELEGRILWGGDEN